MKALNSTQILRPGRWCQGYRFSRQERKTVRKIILGQFRQQLGFKLNFNLNDLSEIATVFYEDTVSGPGFDLLRIKWGTNEVVRGIMPFKDEPKVRKLFALAYAYDVTFSQEDRSAHERAAKSTLAYSQRFLGGLPAKTLVVGTGCMGGGWVTTWQANYGQLILLDIKPFIAEFGKSNIKTVARDFFEYGLAENEEPYQVVQVGYFLSYFDFSKQQQIIDRAIDLMAKGSQQSLLLVVGATDGNSKARTQAYIRMVDPLVRLQLLDERIEPIGDGRLEHTLVFSAS